MTTQSQTFSLKPCADFSGMPGSKLARASPIVVVVVGTRTSEAIAVVIIVAIMMMIVASPDSYAARADVDCCGKCGCGKDEGSDGNCSKNVSSHSFLLRGISTSLYATA
jgi:hypothetical protein